MLHKPPVQRVQTRQRTPTTCATSSCLKQNSKTHPLEGKLIIHSIGCCRWHIYLTQTDKTRYSNPYMYAHTYSTCTIHEATSSNEHHTQSIEYVKYRQTGHTHWKSLTLATTMHLFRVWTMMLQRFLAIVRHAHFVVAHSGNVSVHRRSFSVWLASGIYAHRNKYHLIWSFQSFSVNEILSHISWIDMMRSIDVSEASCDCGCDRRRCDRRCSHAYSCEYGTPPALCAGLLNENSHEFVLFVYGYKSWWSCGARISFGCDILHVVGECRCDQAMAILNLCDPF